MHSTVLSGEDRELRKPRPIPVVIAADQVMLSIGPARSRRFPSVS